MKIPGSRRHCPGLVGARETRVRPAVVIAGAAYLAERPDAVVGILTTKLPGTPFWHKVNGEVNTMETLVEMLNTRLHQWKPETADEVRERVAEIIGLADQDALDLLWSREREQEVLDLLDAPASR